MRPDLFERRFLPSEFEVRTAGDKLTIEGYALKWNVRSGNLGGFKERVAEGATNKTIKEGDIRALQNHDPNLILGRTKSGTLKLANDETGTHYEIDGDLRQSYVRDLAIAMERGDVTQSSFGFRVVGPDGDSWDEDEDGNILRTLKEIQLFDVSPVTYPAYEDSTSGVAKRAAFTRLAEKRGVKLEDVEVNLRALALGIELEPDEERDGVSDESTRLDIPDFDADDLLLRARLLNI
jgi:hypothetical protein